MFKLHYRQSQWLKIRQLNDYDSHTIRRYLITGVNVFTARRCLSVAHWERYRSRYIRFVNNCAFLGLSLIFMSPALFIKFFIVVFAFRVSISIATLCSEDNDCYREGPLYFSTWSVIGRFFLVNRGLSFSFFVNSD